MKKQEKHQIKTEYKLRVLSPSDLDEGLISAWEDLETRAIEANVFLSPHFAIPAIKHLEQNSHLECLFVEKVSGGTSRLTGVALFKPSKPSKYFPLPHLRMLNTKYSFMSGFLVEQDCAVDVLEVIFDHLSHPQGKWHSLVMHDHVADGALSKIESGIANEFGWKWINFRTWDRAVLKPTSIADEALQLLIAKTRKHQRHRMNGLNKLGTVEWKLLFGESLTKKDIDDLVRLENMGWKGEERSSLQSNTSDLIFFQEMVHRFHRANRVFLTEITLNNNTISSTASLIAGKAAFGFKMGWDTAYRKYSPGTLNLIEWLDPGNFPFELELIDSGASESKSYISEIWPHKRPMRSGVYAITNSGKLALPVVNIAAHVNQSIKKKPLRHKHSTH